jgi:hypothetical protein
MNILCMDCDKDIDASGEYGLLYLKDKIWLRANSRGKGTLCAACCEKRLKRKLIASDFYFPEGLMKLRKLFGLYKTDNLWKAIR